MANLVIGENTGDTSGCTDTHIQEAAPTTNDSASSSFEASDFAAGDRKNGVVKFDVSALPAGAVVASTSKLRLWLINQGGSDPRSIDVRRLLKNVVIGQTTWNIYSTGNNWTVAGGEDSADAAAASVSLDTSGLDSLGAYIEFTGAGLAADIQGWKNGTYSNYGWLIVRSDVAESGRYAVFSASEDTDGQRPRLSIDYTLGGGARILTLGVG